MNESTIKPPLDAEGNPITNPGARLAAVERSSAVQEAIAAENALQEYSELLLRGYEPNSEYSSAADEVSQEALDRDPYTSHYEGGDFYYPYINIEEEYIQYTHITDMPVASPVAAPALKTPGFVRGSEVQQEQIEWLGLVKQ